MSPSSWQPSAALSVLRRRAELLDHIRAFFRQRGVMEVETPLLCTSTATDPYLSSIQATYHAGPTQPQMRYLQTSPEFAMKRLLAAGSGPIFQLGKAFRDGERGRRHNPEFTMLEWYRPGFSLDDLMQEVAALVTAICGQMNFEFISYRQALQRLLHIDPFTDALSALQQQAHQLSGLDCVAMTRDDCLDILLSHAVEPQLGRQGGTFLHGYPPSQAALAQTIQVDGHEVAQRFELYLQGVEIANGYFELTDAAEQERRFVADNRRRQQLGLGEIPLDHHLLQALQSGMPSCAGVALGVDRLLMNALGLDSIDEVIAFPIDRI